MLVQNVLDYLKNHLTLTLSTITLNSKTKKGQNNKAEQDSASVLAYECLFCGFKFQLVAYFYGYVVCSADWAGNKLVFSDCVEFKVRIALGASEQDRCFAYMLHSIFSLFFYCFTIKRLLLVCFNYLETAYLLHTLIADGVVLTLCMLNMHFLC